MKIHPDLIVAQRLAYEPNGFAIKNIVQEIESQEYGACRFELNGKLIVFRVAKITPTKIGQFVTIWKRIGNGPIMPFDMADQVDLFVVSVRSGEQLGQFVFPKTVLLQKGYVSQDGKGGKRGMRVYPPWDTVENVQARKTQAWQVNYFCEVGIEKGFERLKQLFE